MIKTCFILIAILFYTHIGYTQVHVDKPIILNGSSSADRQIENLRDPIIPSEITPASIIQKNSDRFGTAVGTDSLAISIPSGTQLYSAGTIIYFKAVANNTGPVKISVNNLPSFPLKIFGTEELKAEQLKANQIYCIIFSGTEFQLLSNTSNNCRAGFAEVNDTYCIEKNQHAATDLWGAMEICNSNNTRLCRWGEWYYACQKGGLGLVQMTDNWEWTDDAANHTIRVAGKFGCTALTNDASTLYPFRCCYSK